MVIEMNWKEIDGFMIKILSSIIVYYLFGMLVIMIITGG